MADPGGMNLRDPKTKLWLSSGAGVTLLIAIAVMINVLSSFLYLRLDFSRGRVYSVDRATKRIISNLPDPVLAKLYYSQELPPEYIFNRNYVRDLLREYAAGSHGKFKLKLIETSDNPADRDRAVKDGVPPVRFQIFSQEKFEQREGFLGLVLQYQDKKDSIPFIKDTKGLEYDITSRIRTLSSTSKPVLGFVTSYDALSPGRLSPELQEMLRSRYDTQSVDLASISVDSGIPANVNALFLLGPKAKLGDKELYLLDQFVLRGKALCVAVDAKRVDTRSFFASDQDTGLLPWIKSKGVEVQNTVVLDGQSQMIQLRDPSSPFPLLAKYPPLISVTALNKTSPITKDLSALMFPFASPLKLDAGSGVAWDPLASSSRISWAKPEANARFIALNPFQLAPPTDADMKGPFTLAAAGIGKFQAYWAQPPAALKAKAPLTQPAAAGRMVVIGTARFISPEFGGADTDAAFLLNIADWMSQDEDLIAIRAKTTSFRPLNELSLWGKRFVRWTNMALPSLLAVLIGLWRWQARNARRRRAREMYGAAQDKPREPAAAA